MYRWLRRGPARSLPVLLLALFFLLAGLPAHSAAAPPPPAGSAADWTPGRVLIKTGDAGVRLWSHGALQARSLAGRLGATVQQLHLAQARELGEGSGIFALDGSADIDVALAVTALRASGAVAYAEPDYIMRASVVPNDEHYADQEWWLTAEQAQAAWDITTGNPGLIIATIDTGIASNHPEFDGRIVEGHNFVDESKEPYDDNGHGTHVAGIAAAQGNNGIGIAGLCWNCKIMPVKALNAQGQGATSAFSEGVRWATDHGARVINISAGADFGTESEHEAIRYARSKGVVVVAAAGNTPDGKPRYPAGYDEVIAVSASSKRDSVAGFSSYGDYVDVAAPGINILSTFVKDRNPTYESESGTSMACPMVSGASALILSVNPNLSPAQVQLLLEQTADDIGDPGFDQKSGYGRINILRALQQAPNGPQPVAPPTATPAPVAPDQSSIQGLVKGIPPEFVNVLLQPQNGLGSRTIQPDASGLYVFNNLTAGHYTVQLALKQGGYEFPPVQAADVTGGKDSVAQINFTLKATRPAAFDTVPAPPNSADLVYFAPVQHTLRGVFLRYWNAHGGLPIFGYPLSEEFQETNAADGKTYTVQYFERNRFESHPEFAGTPNEVLLGLLGVERTQGRNFAPGAPGPNDATHQWFAPVQHNLSDAFLRYWNARGGLAVFGYPISEPFQEVNATDGQTYMVQYFERNRFEYHPAFAGTPNEVLLGLLGVDSLHARGWLP